MIYRCKLSILKFTDNGFYINKGEYIIVDTVLDGGLYVFQRYPIINSSKKYDALTFKEFDKHFEPALNKDLHFEFEL